MADNPLSGLLSLLQSDELNLPSSVGDVISSSLGLHTGPDQVRQGGGCNDAYSAFAFLSFLFALLTFIQNNGGRRRRRAAESQVSWETTIPILMILSAFISFQCFLAGNLRGSREETSVLASAVMYQAFFNALDPGYDQDCSQYSLCEARKEVSRLGRIGSTIGLLAENKANQLLGLPVSDYDVDHEECVQIFPCIGLPKHYKYPAIKR